MHTNKKTRKKTEKNPIAPNRPSRSTDGPLVLFSSIRSFKGTNFSYFAWKFTEKVGSQSRYIQFQMCSAKPFLASQSNRKALLWNCVFAAWISAEAWMLHPATPPNRVDFQAVSWVSEKASLIKLSAVWFLSQRASHLRNTQKLMKLSG